MAAMTAAEDNEYDNSFSEMSLQSIFESFRSNVPKYPMDTFHHSQIKVHSKVLIPEQLLIIVNARNVKSDS